MEAIIFCGIQASGKTTYYNEFYRATHRLISLDQLKTRSREGKEIDDCIGKKESIVIDNTNILAKQRIAYVELLKSNGYLVKCVYFTANPTKSLQRNKLRDEQKRVSDIAIRTSYKNLEMPVYLEGYEEILEVAIVAGRFKVAKGHWMKEVLQNEQSVEQVRQFVGVVWKEHLCIR